MAHTVRNVAHELIHDETAERYLTPADRNWRKALAALRRQGRWQKRDEPLKQANGVCLGWRASAII